MGSDWEAEERLHRVVFATHQGGVEVYDLAGTNASEFRGERLRKGGVAVTLHTSPSHCNQKRCLSIAVRVLGWHLQHPTRKSPKPPSLKHFAMPGRECRDMFERAAPWMQTTGNITLRRTGWGPSVLKEIQKVARDLPPVGGKGPVPFAPLTGNIVAVGLVCTHIVHIILELAKEGCTATLYRHGWSHTWFKPRNPMLFFDEARQRDLRFAKRYAHVTSRQRDISISETFKHERNQKVMRKKEIVPSTKIWAPVHGNVVLEACMVAPNVLWRTPLHICHPISFTCKKHYIAAHKNSLKCTFLGAKEEVDVLCVSGTCGTNGGLWRWVLAEFESIQGWPTLGFKSRAQL